MRLFIDDESEDGALVQVPADAERLGLASHDVRQLAWEERDWWAQEAEFKRAQDRP